MSEEVANFILKSAERRISTSRSHSLSAQEKVTRFRYTEILQFMTLYDSTIGCSTFIDQEDFLVIMISHWHQTSIDFFFHHLLFSQINISAKLIPKTRILCRICCTKRPNYPQNLPSEKSSSSFSKALQFYDGPHSESEEVCLLPMDEHLNSLEVLVYQEFRFPEQKPRFG